MYNLISISMMEEKFCQDFSLKHFSFFATPLLLINYFLIMTLHIFGCWLEMLLSLQILKPASKTLGFIPPAWFVGVITRACRMLRGHEALHRQQLAPRMCGVGIGCLGETENGVADCEPNIILICWKLNWLMENKQCPPFFVVLQYVSKDRLFLQLTWLV